jgi:uncharacterized protein (DUF983 family)
MSGRTQAILSQKCPLCLQGSVFRGGLTMNEACPACGVRFEREQGYFLGALYVAYGLAVPVLSLSVLVLWIAGLGDAGRCFTIAILVLLPVNPIILRYARVVWLHLDQFLDPRPESQNVC